MRGRSPIIVQERRERIEAIAEATLTAAGATTPMARHAAHSRARFENEPEGLAGSLPQGLCDLVDKIARHAYKVTDEDIERLLEAGWSEDELFELIVATATGAGLARLDLGLAALRDACR
jgi:hypothetical protein